MLVPDVSSVLVPDLFPPMMMWHMIMWHMIMWHMIFLDLVQLAAAGTAPPSAAASAGTPFDAFMKQWSYAEARSLGFEKDIFLQNASSSSSPLDDFAKTELAMWSTNPNVVNWSAWRYALKRLPAVFLIQSPPSRIVLRLVHDESSNDGEDSPSGQEVQVCGGSPFWVDARLVEQTLHVTLRGLEGDYYQFLGNLFQHYTEQHKLGGVVKRLQEKLQKSTSSGVVPSATKLDVHALIGEYQKSFLPTLEQKDLACYFPHDEGADEKSLWDDLVALAAKQQHQLSLKVLPASPRGSGEEKTSDSGEGMASMPVLESMVAEWSTQLRAKTFEWMGEKGGENLEVHALQLGAYNLQARLFSPLHAVRTEILDTIGKDVLPHTLFLNYFENQKKWPTPFSMKEEQEDPGTRAAVKKNAEADRFYAVVGKVCAHRRGDFSVSNTWAGQRIKLKNIWCEHVGAASGSGSEFFDAWRKECKDEEKAESKTSIADQVCLHLWTDDDSSSVTPSTDPLNFANGGGPVLKVVLQNEKTQNKFTAFLVDPASLNKDGVDPGLEAYVIGHTELG